MHRIVSELPRQVCFRYEPVDGQGVTRHRLDDVHDCRCRGGLLFHYGYGTTYRAGSHDQRATHQAVGVPVSAVLTFHGGKRSGDDRWGWTDTLAVLGYKPGSD